jgi:hypothetical protein
LTSFSYFNPKLLSILSKHCLVSKVSLCFYSKEKKKKIKRNYTHLYATTCQKQIDDSHVCFHRDLYGSNIETYKNLSFNNIVDNLHVVLYENKKKHTHI